MISCFFQILLIIFILVSLGLSTSFLTLQHKLWPPSQVSVSGLLHDPALCYFSISSAAHTFPLVYSFSQPFFPSSFSYPPHRLFNPAMLIFHILIVFTTKHGKPYSCSTILHIFLFKSPRKIYCINTTTEYFYLIYLSLIFSLHLFEERYKITNTLPSFSVPLILHLVSSILFYHVRSLTTKSCIPCSNLSQAHLIS